MSIEESQTINLLDFQKIGKKSGEPYDILDDKIAEYITTQKLKMFVLNGNPYIYRRGHYILDEDGKILKAHIKAMIWPELITISRVNRVYNLILADYRLTRKNEEVNQYPKHWINFKNGMYDIKLKVMHQHKPEYFSINQVPHVYQENAKYSGTVAEQFLKGIFPDDEDREMFLAYVGYCMTIDTSLQKFLTIIGLPGSGKSTAINLVIDAVGADNVSCITLQDLNERFTPTELLGKLLNACADLPKKALEQVDALKRITGEDLVKGEYKGGKVFSFRSNAKLIFSANEMPVSLDEKSGAFYRRILLIEVMQKGAEIKNLKEDLEKSLPGFIRECVDAVSRLYNSGCEIDSLNSKRLVREYHKESDSVQAFLDDRIDIIPGKKMERTSLYQKYEAYCIANEYGALSSRSFYKNLRGKGYRDHKSCGSRFFSGMCPKSALSGQEDEEFSQATLEENAVFMENYEK
ncbi:MAG: hypothetical protein HFH13_06245 [Dorea sp.]|jgi:P4 family phage/plasmid primase-like protien|nr:hypothetical protein [Dorea sp.]